MCKAVKVSFLKFSSNLLFLDYDIFCYGKSKRRGRSGGVVVEVWLQVGDNNLYFQSVSSWSAGSSEIGMR